MVAWRGGLLLPLSGPQRAPGPLCVLRAFETELPSTCQNRLTVARGGCRAPECGLVLVLAARSAVLLAGVQEVSEARSSGSIHTLPRDRQKGTNGAANTTKSMDMSSRPRKGTNHPINKGSERGCRGAAAPSDVAVRVPARLGDAHPGQ